MKTFRCLILEDEPLATEILTDYVSQVPFLELAGSFTHALAVLAPIQQGNIDLIFLDLHLPGLKGFDFLRTLHRPPKVIVTTAYHEYALEGYELDIVDYLLKPVDFPRFLKAVNKFQLLQVPTSTKSGNTSAIQEEPLFFSENRKNIRLLPSEIIFAESRKDYVVLHTDRSEIITKSTLQDLCGRLPAGMFLRIHRSFVVALSAIRSYSTTEINTGKQTLPIGRSYREQVRAVMGR